jgi:5-methylcytosine-specific restriction protein A
VPFGRCETHARQKDRARGSFRERGYNARWSRLSLAYRRAHPLCVLCLEAGRTVAAECVDHLQPISQGGDMFDETNLRSLCWACHSRITIEAARRT